MPPPASPARWAGPWPGAPGGWSACGRTAVAEAARVLADGGRPLELTAVPGDGTPAAPAVPAVPVHRDLASALARHGGPSGAAREWRTDDWPAAADRGAA
jgi:hypothetical protein